jgi:hypothetical protein
MLPITKQTSPSMTQIRILVWANLLNCSVSAFAEAQKLLEGEESILGRIIRSAKNRKASDIAPGTRFGRFSD